MGDEQEQTKKTNSGVSFGFSKKQEVKKLSKSVVSDSSETEKSNKDYVSLLDGSELSKKTQEKDKEFVIPLIKKNQWRDDKINSNGNIPKDNNIETTPKIESLEEKAVQEILKESAIHNETWEVRGNTDSTVEIPLLMQNKVPEGFESDDKLDVALRPDEPDDADYEQIPIEHFGMAMLRGMGWSKSRGVGKNGQNVVPIEAQVRPKGLGLGANKSNVSTKSDDKKKQDSEESENLVIKKNAFCVIISGINKDLYGVIDGIDEDNSRVMVKLALSGKTVSIMQCNINVVKKTEYEKYSKYINKGKADEYKEKEKQNNKRNENDASRKKQRETTPESCEESTKNSKHKHSKKHHRDEEIHYSRKSKYRKSEETSSKYSNGHTKIEDSDSDYNEQDDSNKKKKSWLRNDLRVRIIDKNLKRGKYYKEKVVVVDVPYPGSCVCRTDDGKVIESVLQSSLETVIPRSDDAAVAIVSGSHQGQLGIIMKRDKGRCLACVQLLSDRDVVLRLLYDEICEYVGNVHDYNDF